ncbi:RING-type E3 ubiquitin-protein ligase PPIL2-like isoform X1 [Artemia franciscana]|uniref:RING-type E3 ubiquitin-protein ligase PPIL2-like isoform X1 n=1 Tax=Artemia franciscana TaxID=6661 RepID=UPI0032DA5945
MSSDDQEFYTEFTYSGYQKTGNVFSYEAIEELNIKSRTWKDLLTDDSFVRSDIITLQDPHNLGKFNISNFHHMRKNLKIENEELKKAEYDPAARIKMAVEELNIKSRNWKDLLTDDSFVRSDIITLQDPHNLGKFNISNFHHMRKNLNHENEELKKAEYDPAARIKMISDEARDTLEELNREYKAPEKIVEEKKLLDKFNAAHYSTGRVAAGFTSTSMEPETLHIAERIEDDLVRYSYVKKKASSHFGPVNIWMANIQFFVALLAAWKHCQL